MSANRLSDEEIREIYTVVMTYHQQYLAEAGVKLPQLEKGGRSTKDALVLVYLAQRRNFPRKHAPTRRGAVPYGST
jgi:N-acyl-L-homoserine lactone synthetase